MISKIQDYGISVDEVDASGSKYNYVIGTNNKKLIQKVQGNSSNEFNLMGYYFPDLTNIDECIVYSDAEIVNFKGGAIIHNGRIVNTNEPYREPGTEVSKLSRKIQWVFPNAKEVNITGFGVIGSVVAPKAKVFGSGGQINGQLFAATLYQKGGFELHNMTSNWEWPEELGELEVIKTDNSTPAKYLPNAKFKLENSKGFSQVATSDTNGKLAFKNLSFGEYTLTEVEAPEGYSISKDSPWKVTISSKTKVEKVIVNEAKEKLGKLEVIKSDDITGKLLAGAEFTLTGSNNFSKVAVTGEDGKAVFEGLHFGEYTLTETKAPENYKIIGSGTWSVVVDSETIITKNITNTEKLGKLEVVKSDDVTGRLLAGAEFTLTGSNDFSKVVVTREDGKAVFEGLHFGEYTLTETKAPENYKIIGNRTWTVVVESETVITKNITNTEKLGRLDLVKTNESGNLLLSGAVFRLEGPNGFVKELTTGTDGKLSFEGLYFGDYILTEIKAPNGYKVSTESPWNIKINEETIVSKTIKNVEKLGKLEIIKTDELTSASLSGAEFTLSGPDGYSLSKVTDEDGKLVFDQLKLGIYTLTETKAPNGYNIPDENQWIILVLNESVIGMEIENTPIEKLGKLEVIKSDDVTGKLLAGAEFTLTGSNDFSKVVVTGEDGKATFEGLHFGEYTLTETKAPENYKIIGSGTWSVVVESETIITKNITNTEKLGKLEIIKTDALTSASLSGAEFTLSGSDGYSLSKVTGEDGKLVFDQLKLGIYTLTETKAPNGYNIPDENQWIILVLNESVIGMEIENTPIEKLGKLEVIKSDDITGNLLAGAEFTLMGENDFSKAVVTGEDGKATFEGLHFGEYTLTETKAPENYKIIGSGTWSVVVDSETVITKNITNTEKLGKLEVVKSDDVTGKLLAGAEFTLTGSNDFSKVVITGEDGKATFEGLHFGEYTLTETKAPENYKIIGSGTWSVVVDSETIITKNITNTEKLGKLEVIKSDDVTGKLLAGAEFTLTGENDFSKVVVTGEDGKAIFEGLHFGEYTLTETKAPENYKIIGSGTWSVVVDSETIITKNITNTEKLGKLEVIKSDDVTGKLLAGAEFTLTGSNDFSKVVVTGEDGKAVFEGLHFGEYTLTETKAPENYKIIGSGTWSVVVDSETIITKNITNTEKLGKLEVVKSDDVTGKLLSGAEFTLTGSNDFSKVVVTGEDGKAVFEGLHFGEYTLTETKAPENYKIIGSGTWSVVVESETIITKNITNTEKLGKLEVVKSDDVTGKLLAGAEFTLTGSNDFSKVVVTGEDGKATFEGLHFGEYTLTETKAPENYKIIGSGTWSVVVDSETIITKNITNTEKLGKLEVIKSDDVTGKLLAGAEFTLTGENDFSKVVVTGEDGKAVFEGLHFGEYTLTETKAPENYKIIGDGIWVVTVDSETVITKNITNTEKLGKLEVVKSDDVTGKLLAGAEFTLTGSNDFSKVVVTGEDGKATFEGLHFGEYTLTETKAPKNYKIIGSGTWSVVVDSETVITKNITNTEKLGKLEVVKSDDVTGKLLAGAEFTLTGENDFSKVVVTGEDGKAVFEGLHFGEYTLTETKAPKNYKIIGSGTWSVVVDSETVITKNITNTEKLGKLEVIKSDDITGKLLAGAEFTLTGENDFSKVVVTGEDGKAVFEGLHFGEYTLTETKAPENYKIIGDGTLTVTVDSETVITKNITNTEKLGKLEITKYDSSTGKTLAGAEFNVIGPNGYNETKVSGADGKIIFENLHLGEYIITETKSPDGYRLSKENTKKISISDEEIVKLSVNNEKIVVKTESVKTGDDSGIGYLLLISLLSLCIMTGVVYKGKKAYKNN